MFHVKQSIELINIVVGAIPCGCPFYKNAPMFHVKQRHCTENNDNVPCETTNSTEKLATVPRETTVLF